MNSDERKDLVRLPDIEIIVQAASFQVFTVAFYAGKMPADGFEVVSAIYDMDDKVHLVEVLQTAINQLRLDRWVTMDELDTRSLEDKNSPPF